jgi:hypothetical protein
LAAALSLPEAARSVTWNVFADLDDSPAAYHITEPVDPTEYYNSPIGSVLGDLY